MKKIKQKLHLRENPELIAPSIRIAPPPPSIHLNKKSHLKYLFKSSISRFVLLGMTVMLIIISCGNEDASSTSPSLTSLTYPNSKINATQGNKISNITPIIIPQDAMAEYTVKPLLPAGLEINSKSGTINGTPTDAYVAEAVYTVTATGTGDYTGSVTAGSITIAVGTLSRNIVVTETAKTDSGKDRRYHYVVFTVKADGTSSLGRHKFALKLKTDPAPSVQEMNDGAGVYRIVNNSEKKILLSYSLSSGIRALATNNNYLGSTVKNGDTVDGEVVDVDSYLLIPGETYTLYALKDTDSSVKAIKDFNTDTFDSNNTPLTDGYFNDPAMSGEYFYDASDVIFVLPVSLFDTDSTSYILVSNENSPPRLIIGNTLGEPDPILVDSSTTGLIPSHFTDGGKEYRIIDGKNVVGLFAILPVTLFPVEGGYSEHLRASLFVWTPLVSITFHPDR